jgi:hypothetical protein
MIKENKIGGIFMNKQYQNQAEEALLGVQEGISVLQDSGVLVKTDAETKLLKAFRLLNVINKVSIISRIQGMLEAQTYAKSLDE